MSLSHTLTLTPDTLSGGQTRRTLQSQFKIRMPFDSAI